MTGPEGSSQSDYWNCDNRAGAMLVGVAIDPACFGPGVIVDQESRYSAERVLDAILSNAMLVCGSNNEYLDKLVAEIESLGDRLGRDIQIRVEELLKRQRSCLVTLNRTMPDSDMDALRESAIGLRAERRCFDTGWGIGLSKSSPGRPRCSRGSTARDGACRVVI